MMAHLAALRETVRRHAEDRPGIYRMWGPGEDPLYVGKSVRVKSRLLSYFRAETGEKAFKLMRDTASITWEYVPNEFSALLREMRLIKRCRPRYNVEHARSRSFAFVKVTGEAAPRIVAVSRVIPDGALYFGPFPRPRLLAQTVRDLAQALALRDCPGPVPARFADQLEMFAGALRPRCLRVETRSCLGPCCGGCTSSGYQDAVEKARCFLEGKTREPLLRLEEEMNGAARLLEFEHAARIRDRLQRLTALQAEMLAFRGRVAGLSFVYRAPGFRGNDRMYIIREGVVEEEIPYPRGRAGRARAARKVEEVFRSSPREPRTLTPETASEILLVARWFRLRAGELSRTLHPEAWLNACDPSPG
jgi:excinuclease ABC subunit C